jgi:hypothetical protein
MAYSTLRAASAAAVVAVSVTLSGCGGVDGIELNGKVFDWMGVSSAAQKASNTEAKLPARAGLVMPPDANRLPEPGSGQDGSEIQTQLNDPDRKRELAAAERERLHKAYCSGEINWKERMLKGEKGAPQSPFGPCTAIGAIVNSSGR